MSGSRTKELCDSMNWEFTHSRWVWRQNGLWNVSYFAGGWETWRTLDDVATEWRLMGDRDKQVIKDCLQNVLSFVFTWEVCTII